MRTLFAALFLVGVTNFALVAEVTVKQYKAEIVSPNETLVLMVKTHIAGLGTGISWASITSKRVNGVALYCQPEKLALGTDNYIDILDRQIKKFSEMDLVKVEEMPIVLLLISGLQETFPCKAK